MLNYHSAERPIYIHRFGHCMLSILFVLLPRSRSSQRSRLFKGPTEPAAFLNVNGRYQENASGTSLICIKKRHFFSLTERMLIQGNAATTSAFPGGGSNLSGLYVPGVLPASITRRAYNNKRPAGAPWYEKIQPNLRVIDLLTLNLL